MRAPLPSDTFPQLSLSKDDKRILEKSANAIVQQTIVQYHEHLSVHNSVVDERRWKKIKQREDVRVYRERQASFDGGKAAATLNATSGAVVSITTFGSIPGNLDDVMYGLLNPNVETMQLKSAYVKDGVVDWAVLATIRKPTEQDPFRELSIQWILIDNPLPVSAVARNRDALFIESIGIARTPDGERIGYHLSNSVDIPEIRELEDLSIVRLKMTYCQFFRQRKDNCVEAYGRGLFSPMGGAPAVVASATAGEVLVAVWQHVYCSEMKKLTRLMTTGPRQLNGADSRMFPSLSISTSRSSSDFGVRASSSSATDACALCSRRLGSGLAFAGSKGKCCRICDAHVCSRCRVSKMVHLPTHVEKQIVSSKMPFCTRCIFTASSASSYKFAVLDTLAAEGVSVDYTEALRG